MRWLLAALVMAGALLPAHAAAFRFEDTDTGVTLHDGDLPVLTYHTGMVTPPKFVPQERYTRTAYIHPLYGLDGEVLTQDFPLDHFHHRGVFWAWPESTWDGKKVDVWTLDGARKHPVQVLGTEANDTVARLAFENAWRMDDQPEKDLVREQVVITVHGAADETRAIDFMVTLTNVTDKPFTLLGAKDKGYGGFCVRPDARLKPMSFTSALGPHDEDVLSVDSPWADVSFSKERDSEAQSGVALFQHPKNPGYPHHGWIFRHYAFLGASWPHEDPHTLEPGKSVSLRYRLLVHRGSAEAANVDEHHNAYVAEFRPAPK